VLLKVRGFNIAIFAEFRSWLFINIFLLFGMCPIISVFIRRMHNIGKRGWWILIPLVNIVMCGFFRGKKEGNPCA